MLQNNTFDENRDRRDSKYLPISIAHKNKVMLMFDIIQPTERVAAKGLTFFKSQKLSSFFLQFITFRCPSIIQSVSVVIFQR